MHGDLPYLGELIEDLSHTSAENLEELYHLAWERRVDQTTAAAAFFLRSYLVKGRDMRKGEKKKLSPLRSSERLFLSVRKALRDTHLTCLDYQDALSAFDDEEVVFLADPPWPGSSQGFEFDLEGRHEELALRLAGAKGDAIVCLQSTRKSLELARHFPYAYFSRNSQAKELLLSTFPLLGVGSEIVLSEFGL